MNILKTFELFWSLPQRLFGKKNIKVVHIETTQKDNAEYSLQTQTDDESIQINVYNSQKVYSLLTTVLYKKKMLNENKISQIYKERSVS